MESSQKNSSTNITNNKINKTQSDFLDKTKITNLDLIEIDGSLLEGGGQILRISLALSLIFNKQIKIDKIRAGRETPGLKNQHLSSVLCLKSIFKPEISGAELKSEQLAFKPVFALENEAIEIENVICDCGSAGSIGLMIQQLLPCLLFANFKFNDSRNAAVKLKFKGGTLVNFSPSTFYLNDVLRIILAEKMNVCFDLNVERHGIFPAGGGCVELSLIRNLQKENNSENNNEEENDFNLNNNLSSNLIKSINVLKRGNIKKLVLRVIYTKNLSGLVNLDAYLKTLLNEIKKLIIQNLKINYSFTDSAKLDYEELENLNFLLIETSFIELPGNKTGYTLFTNANLYFENTVITAESLLSEKKSPTNEQRNKIKADFLAEVETVLSNENICFDEYTVDHLIIFMGLAKGISKISVGKVSLHTLTAIEILKKFIPEIKVEICKINAGEESKMESNFIEIEGIGI